MGVIMAVTVIVAVIMVVRMGVIMAVNVIVAVIKPMSMVVVIMTFAKKVDVTMAS